ncbi:hypothetical protein AB5I39_12240 [Sphingomonas sp. MMS24-J45]|uniref:hypothetical protein n=1 Tax=Sphingomonas sp. MMS24-J45 TaxID=3238806 RepID=UPI003850E3F9
MTDFTRFDREPDAAMMTKRPWNTPLVMLSEVSGSQKSFNPSEYNGTTGSGGPLILGPS